VRKNFLITKILQYSDLIEHLSQTNKYVRTYVSAQESSSAHKVQTKVRPHVKNINRSIVLFNFLTLEFWLRVNRELWN